MTGALCTKNRMFNGVLVFHFENENPRMNELGENIYGAIHKRIKFRSQGVGGKFYALIFLVAFPLLFLEIKPGIYRFFHLLLFSLYRLPVKVLMLARITSVMIYLNLIGL